MTNTHTYISCLRSAGPLEPIIFILLRITSCVRSCFSVFVLWLFIFCISSTLCKFYQIHQIQFENAKFFLTLLQIHYLSITSKLARINLVFQSTNPHEDCCQRYILVFWSPKMPLTLFPWNVHTKPEMSLS